MPRAGRYLWRIFLRLHRRRSSNGFGSNPLSWSEMAAMAAVTRFPLLPWEVELLEDLDDLYLVEQGRQHAGD